MREQFDKPVHVALGPYGNILYIVDTPRMAADKLLNQWPAEPGKQHLAARKAILKAMENDQDAALAAKARKAFEAAAQEAGILRPPPLRPERIPGDKPPRWRKRRR